MPPERPSILKKTLFCGAKTAMLYRFLHCSSCKSCFPFQSKYLIPSKSKSLEQFWLANGCPQFLASRLSSQPNDASHRQFAEAGKRTADSSSQAYPLPFLIIFKADSNPPPSDHPQ
jgi:hypothetical protein